MPEPVLDVGCGSDAAMVRYLRQRGVEAYGIDRFAPERIDGVVTADWLEFNYGEDRWGTVISHLGLSLHFLRHHLVDGPAAETLALAHARAYMRILTSLRPGGSFAYAPALSSVEELLPASDYRCERVGRARYIRLAHGPRAHGARPSPSLARLTGRVVLPTNRGEWLRSRPHGSAGLVVYRGLKRL